jgi:hypothetical protein
VCPVRGVARHPGTGGGLLSSDCASQSAVDVLVHVFELGAQVSALLRYPMTVPKGRWMHPVPAATSAVRSGSRDALCEFRA